MLLLFDEGIINSLDVNKFTHLVSGGIHSTFPEICYGVLLSRLLEISAIKISYYYYYISCIIIDKSEHSKPMLYSAHGMVNGC